MDPVKRVVIIAALAGCGLDVGPGSGWAPAEMIGAPLLLQSGAPSQAAPGRPDTLRIVTYNVEMGGNPDALAAAMLGDAEIAAGDIFLIQEEEDYPAEGRCRTVRLAEQLGLHWIYVPGRTKLDGTHGLAILSRFPIEAPQVMTLPETEKGDQRIAVRADIVIGERRLPVVDVHLDVFLNITDRILQLRPAVIDLPPTVIVAGDVNTNPFLWEDGSVPLVPTAEIVDTDQAPILDDYMRALGFTAAAAGAGPTQRALGIESRLDAIYVRGLAATPATVERDVTGSDHWPVWTEVTLP
jgi:endonuclease/exonuclease/phosphatase family metal-dependent hydrolase